MVLAHTAFAGVRLTLTLAALHRGASALVVGFIISLLMVGPALTSVWIGRWTDRVGYFRPSVIGLVMSLGGGLAAGLSTGLFELGLSSALVGSGAAMLQVGIMHAIGRSAGAKHLASAFSAMALGYSISGFLGPVLAGILIDSLGYAKSFLALCIPSALAFVVLRVSAIVLPDVPTKVDSVSKKQHTPGLWSDAQLRSVLVITVMLAIGWDFFTFVMPLHASRLGLSASAIGSIAGCLSAGMFSIRLLLGPIASRFTERQILFSALILSSVGFLVFPFAGDFVSLAVLAYALGLVMGCGTPMTMSLLHRSAPAGRSGEAVGLRTMIVSSSQATMPLIFGVIGSTVGMLPAFWSVAAILGCSLLYIRRRM